MRVFFLLILVFFSRMAFSDAGSVIFLNNKEVNSLMASADAIHNINPEFEIFSASVENHGEYLIVELSGKKRTDTEVGGGTLTYKLKIDSKNNSVIETKKYFSR